MGSCSKTIGLWTLVVLLSGWAVPLWGTEKLVLLSPHWEGIRFEFERAFQDAYRAETGEEIALQWLDVGGTSDILRFIKSEFANKPEGIGVDILFGGGTDPFVELKRLGFLQAYRIPETELEKIPKTIGGIPLYDEDYAWYAATMAGFGIVYNRKVLEWMKFPEPRSWEDLADPALYSWVGSADPRNSGSVHMAYEIILQAYGWERGWQVLTALGANVRNFSAAASQSAKEVAVGEVAYALAIDFYAWAQAKEVGEDKIGYVMPENLTVVNADAIAILKGAPHRETAQSFLRFVLSERGQKLWLLKKGAAEGPKQFELDRFSILPSLYEKVGAQSAVRMNPFRWKSNFLYDSQKGSARWSILNDLIGVMIIDSRDQLKRAWREVIRKENVEQGIRQLARMPVSEKEVSALAQEGKWRDPKFRNQTIAQWTAFAREKYQSGRRRTISWRGLLRLGMLVGTLIIIGYMMRINRTEKR